MVYTEQSLGEALLTRGLIKKEDEEILQECFARCCMGEHYLTMAIQGRFEEDVVFRLGGDEFAAFVRNMENPDEKIAQIMCRMKHELEAAREAKKFCDTGREKRKDTG